LLINRTNYKRRRKAQLLCCLRVFWWGLQTGQFEQYKYSATWFGIA
jgi:hypothetical protein